MKRILLAIMIIVLVACSACSSSLTQGSQSSDEDYAFLLVSAQTIDRIGETGAPEGKMFLVLKYEVENLQDRDDSSRLWPAHIWLEDDEEYYSATSIADLDGQMWSTSLLKNEKKEGYIVYTVPDDIQDFTLTFSFPNSGNKAVYDFRPVDRRVSVNAEHVFTRLEQIERTKRIAVIGGILAAVSNSPIRYLGAILVPQEDVSGLLERIKGLDEDGKRAVIEDYLIEQGQCSLE